MKQVHSINIAISKLLLVIFKIIRKIHFPQIFVKLFYKIYFTYVVHILKPYFKQTLRHINPVRKFKGHKNSSVIWMFWWQGYKNMPLLVKRCVQSVKNNADGHKVILITKSNISNYVNISKVILKKVNNHKLDFTHFSDIIRFNLLDQYGGLWVDSTMYCTSKIVNKYFNYLYTSGGYHNTLPEFVGGRWAEFLIGGNKANNALKFIDNFLQLYFSRNNKLPSYFLADYALDYSYNHNLGNFKSYVDNIANKNNPNLFKLVNLLNSPYNKNEFKDIKENTNMFKLTYKKRFNDNGNTFYSKLINN